MLLSLYIYIYTYIYTHISLALSLFINASTIMYTIICGVSLLFPFFLLRLA